MDENLLKELEKSQPELVARYRAKMAAPDAAVSSAQGMQDVGSIANLLGKSAMDYGNADRGSVILHNRMKDLGSAPKVIAPELQKYDSSVIDNAGKRGVDRAKEAQTQARADFGMEQELTDLGTKRSDQALERGDKALARSRDLEQNDPASPASQAARDALISAAPGAAQISGFDQMSAAQVEKYAPWAMEAMKRQAVAQERAIASQNRREDRQDMLGIRQDAATAAKSAKDADYQASVKVPGMSVAPGFRPTVQGAKEVRDAQVSKDNMVKSLDALDSLYTRSGTNIIGDDAVTQANLTADIKLQLKDLLRLGALSGSDYASLDALVPDASSTSENLKGLVGMDSFAAKSKVFRDSLDSKLRNKARSSGYMIDPAQSTPDQGRKSWED